MSDATRKGATEIRRHIWREQNAIAAVADFSDLLLEYRRHTRRWDVKIDDLSYVMVRQGLAGAALQLSCRPHEEAVAFTFNIHKPALNIFITGRGRECTVIGRPFLDNVKAEKASRLFVETSRPGLEPTRSLVEVTGLDLLVMYEQYFEKSVQLHTRFFELEDDVMAMVQGLPNVDVDWIRGLDREEARRLLDEEKEVIESTTFHLECGCDGDRIASTLVSMWGDDPDELFGGDGGVEVSCPRCATRWFIDREKFDEQRLRDSLGGDPQ